jgi:hypothetical protein
VGIVAGAIVESVGSSVSPGPTCAPRRPAGTAWEGRGLVAGVAGPEAGVVRAEALAVAADAAASAMNG